MGEKDNVTSEKKTYLYFENLDGVRAIAALAVVVSHIEYHKQLFGLAAYQGLNLHNLGKVGVTIFFSLSGFLITYLLLEEKNNFKKIHLKDFYIRRILRIWPLYYLIILIGFFIYPAEGSTKAFLQSVFFLPNLAFTLALLPSIFDPIWSIGTEEQFYLFHPHIFKIKKLQHILYTLLAVTIFFIGFSGAIRLLAGNSIFLKDLGQLLYYARFSNMLIGAMAAVLFFNTKHQHVKFVFQRLFNLMFNKYIQFALYATFIIYLYLFIQYEPSLGDIVISFLSSIIIINLCRPETSILNIKSSLIKYCGKISYGIYLIHKFPLYLVLYLASRYLNKLPMWQQNLFIYPATFLFVILLASASYYGYERYFLRFKKRFQKMTTPKSI